MAKERGMWYNGITMKFSEEYKELVVDMYLGGKSSADLRRELGHDPNTVLDWVREFGFQVRSFSEGASMARANSSPLSEDGLQKRCGICNQYKELTEFKSNPSGSGGVYSICRNCLSEKRKEAYQKDPEPAKSKQKQLRKEKPEVFRGYDLKKRYKITLEDFDRLFENQGRKCAACGSTDSGEKPPRTWHIDHDHACCPNRRGGTCGKCIRGILCRPCNMAAGNAEDSIERLRGIASYLENYQKKGPGENG